MSSSESIRYVKLRIKFYCLEIKATYLLATRFINKASRLREQIEFRIHDKEH
ncbi:MAG: hypothetical protein QXM92_02480 [Candidatus Anstonellales archaeon]